MSFWNLGLFVELSSTAYMDLVQVEEVMSGDGSRVDWDCDPGYTVGPKSCSFAALREKSSDSGRVDFGEAVYHNYITHFCIQVIHDGSWSSHGKEAG